MTITYERAAAIVYNEASSEWDPSWGTFVLDDRDVVEDEEVFVFVVGSREMLVDMNPDFLMAGDRNGVVSKADGSLTWVPWLFVQEEHPNLVERPNPNPRYFLS